MYFGAGGRRILHGAVRRDGDGDLEIDGLGIEYLVACLHFFVNCLIARLEYLFDFLSF